jgi:hypothetical protein
MGSSISDDMRAIWKSSFSGKLTAPDGESWEYTIRTSATYRWLRQTFQGTVLPLTSALLLGYLIIFLTSHLAFNFWDAAGFVCKDAVDPTKLKKMVPGEKVQKPFVTSNVCQSMDVLLERNGRYLIQFDSTASFRDGIFNIDASKGFASSDLPTRSQRIMLTLATPLRREWLRPWFYVVARFGGTGGEESFLDPDLTDPHWIDEPVRATRDGELFLFVNYPVIGVPGLFGFFYKNNLGSATVTIVRKS